MVRFEEARVNSDWGGGGGGGGGAGDLGECF